MPAAFSSLQEFLEWGRQQDAEYEFLGGSARPALRDSLVRNIIRGNIYAALRARHPPDECRFLLRGMRLITPSGEVLYPQIMGACGAMGANTIQMTDALFVVDLQDRRRHRAETENRIRAYQSLVSIRHILLVSDSERAVELVSRPARPSAGWIRRSITGEHALVALSASGVTLGLGDIYADLEDLIE